jgi:5'-nucleotidase
MTKELVYVDMDDVLCDYAGAFEARIKACPEVAYPQSQYGFFSSLEPINGAVESVKTLIDRGYNVYVLTCPSFRNPLCYTEKRLWIEKYFGLAFTERLIISTNKGLLKGDILIDDHVSGAGQQDFDGELVQFGSSEYKTWVDVMQRFD